MSSTRAEYQRAAKVAAIATAIGVVCYIASVLVLNVVVLDHVQGQVDVRLSAEAHTVARVVNPRANDPVVRADIASDHDTDDVPVYLWRVGPSGNAAPLTPGSPPLAPHQWVPGAQSLGIGASSFRLDVVSTPYGWLVAGESLAQVNRVGSLLVLAEIIVGVILLILMFLAAEVVGVRALAPIAVAQRRRAQFTADASHELRTPLTVIEAEVEIALGRDRAPGEYQETLRRIGAEGRRLRRIVNDLLWLARADDTAHEARADQVRDLASHVGGEVERFASLATSRGIELRWSSTRGPLFIRATSDDIDHLVGVLVDNALKFAGHGGVVEVELRAEAARVVLAVGDSGPGIAPQDRDGIFERFRHSDHPGGGVGLGLAIADAIIHSTNALCTVGDSHLGGALFEVSWKAQSRSDA